MIARNNIQSKYHTKNFGIVIFFIFVFIFVFSPRATQAFGLSPAEVVVENLGVKLKVERFIIISRGNPTEDEVVDIKIGGSAAQYVKPISEGPLTLKKGEQQTQFYFTIESGSLGEGTYEAEIVVTPSLSKTKISSGAGTGFLSGAKGKIIFTVTNQEIESFAVRDVIMRDTEEEQFPGLSFIVMNDGNVDTRPSAIILTLTDVIDPANTHMETIPGDVLAFVPALSEQQFDLITKFVLTRGMYRAHIQFLNRDGSIVFESDTNRVQVVPKGSLQQEGNLESFRTSKNKYESGEIVKFIGAFKNTGTIDLTASLFIEVYEGDKQLDTLKVEPTFVPIGRTIELETTFRPQKGGDYRSLGFVRYGIHQTEKVEAQFNITEISITMILGFIGVLIVLIVIIVIFILHRRKKKHMKKVDL